MKPIDELKHKYEGHDIYVIAAGPSMDMIPDEFFKDKITIGVNEVYKKYDCTYYLRKEIDGAKEAYEVVGNRLVVSEYDCGSLLKDKNTLGGYYFKHRDNGCCFPPDFSLDDDIIVSYSTITSAIHFAYFLGAKNIIICGHDCTFESDHCNFKEYGTRSGKDLEFYREWLPKIKPHTDELVKLLRDRNVGVYTMKGYE